MEVPNALTHDTILSINKMIERTHSWSIHDIVDTIKVFNVLPHDTILSINRMIERTQCWSIHDIVDTMKVSNVLQHDTILFDKWFDRNDTILVNT